LVHRAKAVCDTDGLPQELKFPRATFRDNGYGEKQILHALNPPTRDPPPREDHTSVAFLPFVDTTLNRISRVLSKHNIKTVGLPPRKLSRFIRPVKDHLALKTPGVYSIPCECEKVYIGHTGLSIETRVKEHRRHIRLAHPAKSAVAEHSTNLGAIVSSCTTPVFWPRSRDTWTVSSGKRSRLSSIQTTLIGRMAYPSAGHGSLSFATYGNKKPAPNKNTTHSDEP
jgi:hypothetical protein